MATPGPLTSPLAVPPEWLEPVTLRLEGDCPGYARSDVRVRGHVVTIDEPPERDGTDRGPAPTELMIAALIGVCNVILRRIARRDGIALHHLNITAAAELDGRGVWLAEPVDIPWRQIHLTLTIATDADDDRLALWRADLGRFSPIHATLRAAGTLITEDWIRA